MTATHAIGVDVGGTKILAGVVTRDGEVVRRHERPTPSGRPGIGRSGARGGGRRAVTDEIGAIGFGVPSPIDQRLGLVVECVNMPLDDFRFAIT